MATKRTGTFMFNQYPKPLYSALNAHLASLKSSSSATFFLVEPITLTNLTFSTCPPRSGRANHTSNPFWQLKKLFENQDRGFGFLIRLRVSESKGSSFKNWYKQNAISTQDQLLNLFYKELPIGKAIANYVARVKRTSDFSVSSNLFLIWKLYCAYTDVADAVSSCIKSQQIDYLQIYQGNFLFDRCVLDIAIREKISFCVFGEVINEEFWQVVHFPFDDYNAWISLLKYDQELQKYEKQNSQNWLSDSHHYFRQIAQNTFTKPQTIGYLRSEIPESRIVTYFSGNPNDERFGFSKDWDSELSDQFRVIDFLQKKFEHTDYSLVVRVHPNTRNKARDYKKKWKSIDQQPNRILILADDKDDTYALLERSSLVISPGSTISLEASARGISSITTLPAIYDGILATYRARDFNELEKLIDKFLEDGLPNINAGAARNFHNLRREKSWQKSEHVQEHLGWSLKDFCTKMSPSRLVALELKAFKLMTLVSTLLGNIVASKFQIEYKKAK